MYLIIGPIISTLMLFDLCIIDPLRAITVPFPESASLITDASIAMMFFGLVGAILIGFVFFGSTSSCGVSSSFSFMSGLVHVSLIFVFLSFLIVCRHSSE